MGIDPDKGRLNAGALQAREHRDRRATIPCNRYRAFAQTHGDIDEFGNRAMQHRQAFRRPITQVMRPVLPCIAGGRSSESGFRLFKKLWGENPTVRHRKMVPHRVEVGNWLGRCKWQM